MVFSIYSFFYWGVVSYFFTVKKKGKSLVKKSPIHIENLIVFSTYEIKIFIILSVLTGLVSYSTAEETNSI